MIAIKEIDTCMKLPRIVYTTRYNNIDVSHESMDVFSGGLAGGYP